MRLPIVIGIGLVMSLGLNAPVMSQLSPQVEPLPAIVDSDLLEQLRLYRKNRRLWNQQGIRNYRYTLSNSCFCIPEARGPVIIEVRNGITTSITSKETGQPVNPEFFQQYDTIPRLFNVIRNAIARRADNLDVEYDSKLGYPTQINIDYSFQIADEEVFLTIENLEVLP
jgi:Family of unknown function (DUF6174)